MDPERFKEVKRIFHLAMEADEAGRPARIAEACAGDDALRREVESLFASLAEADGFIEDSAVSGDGIRDLVDGEAASSRQIGPYYLLHELDRGGMGLVYAAATRADATAPEVAIKLLQPQIEEARLQGLLRQEWQILARLDHPNVARLFEAGTTRDGRPYFAMEYVEGTPILDYCDHFQLPVPDRLRLVIKVCSALDAAHRQSILHRDVKPDNVLVRRDGEPKLLDFGIAKLLRPELSYETAFATATGMRFISPEYSSPEQVMDRDLTPASDVYSLGVVLYELLTGHMPYRIRQRTPAEILRVVCREVPEKPSRIVLRHEEIERSDGTTVVIVPAKVAADRRCELADLASLLSGELDRVLDKALRKEPQGRYASVLELANDLERRLTAESSGWQQGWHLQATVQRNGRRLFEERFDRSPVRIGGSPDNDLVLTDPHVSGHHAYVVVSRDRILYRDHSRNGSFVGGERVQDRELMPGVPVSIPPFEVFFELVEGPEDRRTAVRPGVSENGAAALYYLHLLEPPRLRGRSFPLRGSPLTIGRDRNAEIDVEIGTLSRFHATLSRRSQGWYVTDLGSSNGTYVNNLRVDERAGQPLAAGDRVVLGDLVLLFSDRQELPG